MIRKLQFFEKVTDAVKALDVQNPASDQDKRKHDVWSQFQWVLENKIWRLKKGTPSKDETKEAIGDNRRNPRRDNDLGLKLRFAV